MTIHEHIDNFLRDGQYRVGQLSVELQTLDKEGSYLYDAKFKQRLEITMLMSMLYEGRWYIQDGYNHVQYGDGDEQWTEREIISEIEHIRYYTNMNEMPFINFTAHYPQIAFYLGIPESPGSATPFPPGTSGQAIFYNSQGEPYAETIDSYAGMYDTETINDYFANRL